MPTQPDTVARWRTGTWSGMAALRLAYSPFWNALNRNHSRATPNTVACSASTTMQAAASTAMPSVQRCRRPLNRPSRRPCAVRSDSMPTIGVARAEEMAPTPVTTASATTLCLGVMSCSWRASMTCSGVWVAIHMPRLARVRPRIQRCRTCWSGSASASDSASAWPIVSLMTPS